MNDDNLEDRVCDGTYMLALTFGELSELDKRLDDYIEYRRWEDGPGNFFYDSRTPRRDQRAMVGTGNGDYILNQARKQARLRRHSRYDKGNRDEARRRRYENYRTSPARGDEGRLKLSYVQRMLSRWPIGAEEGLSRYLSHMTREELDVVRPMLAQNPAYEVLKPSYERIYGTKSVGGELQPLPNG